MTEINEQENSITFRNEYGVATTFRKNKDGKLFVGGATELTEQQQEELKKWINTNL